MDSVRSSSRRSMRKKKRDKEIVFEEFWTKNPPPECDVITDVIDKGDHIKLTSCTREAAPWWLGALRAVYPDEKPTTRGDTAKIQPESGVTLTVNKADGTVRIKGKKHVEWFREHIHTILDHGSKQLAASAELGAIIDLHLRLEDGYTVHDLLEHLPPTGALKHGPTYIYRLWRGLLDQWAGRGGDLYVITPLIDAKRVSDLLLTLAKHRRSRSRLHVFTMPTCDGDAKWQRVLKDARDLVKEMKSPNKKRLVSDERLRLAEERLTTQFGRFHCKMIATCNMETGQAEIFITSASFHKWHFDLESGDTVLYFKMAAKSLVNDYLAPLGLEQQVALVDSTASSEQGTLNSATGVIARAPSRDNVQR